ncbi:MAG: AAA family ATPase [Thermoanaerobaculia bacterium]
MRLVSFQVTNFRSINDSSPVEVLHRTVLVGRNESGKSSLLRALQGLKGPGGVMEDFTFARDYPRDRPRKDFSENLPVGTTRWELTGEDREALGKVWPRAGQVSHVVVYRTYEKGKRYIRFEGVIDKATLGASAAATFKKLSTAVRTAMKKTAPEPQEIDAPLAALEASVTSDLSEAGWADRLTAALTNLNSTLKAAGMNVTGAVETHRADLEQAATSVKSDAAQHEQARTWVTKNLPVFVYLDEWQFLEGHENITQYLQNLANGKLTSENRNFAKLMKVAELDAKELNDLLNQNHEERKLLTNRAGRVVTRTLRELWKDREITVEFNVDADNFDVLVSDKDTDALVPLDERSRGFRWYFSFYVTFAADTEGGDKANAILLLDEPGLFLHATAQSSLLRFFDQLPNQIIYTTHSPFMIDAGRLETVRTVNLGESGGTTVSGDPTGDANTLFPLQAALGYTLTQTLFIGTRNVVVEGVTDFWYLTAASEYLAGQDRPALRDIVVTPAGGAQRISYMVALLTAQDLRVVVLFDSEPQAELAKKDLVTTKLIRSENVVLVGDAFAQQPNGGSDIEDLLDESVFVQLVKDSYAEELKGVSLALNPKIPRIVKRVEDAFEKAGLRFHKTRPANLFLREMARDPAKILTSTAAERFSTLFELLNGAVDRQESSARKPFR